MGFTIIEKIMSAHAGQEVSPGDVVDVLIDARVARDFGGANVVKNMEDNGLEIEDASRTYFTLDCNPCGSDQEYAANQQICRRFARARGVKVYDIDSGIGTHIAIDEGLVGPGGTLVSTDSHANILGAIGAFGQGMGDQDIAYAWAKGAVWFAVPPTFKIALKGRPGPAATAKDVVLACLRRFGAGGLLGYAAEYYGEAAGDMSLDGRITVASMATEMGGIITFFPPSKEVLARLNRVNSKGVTPAFADPDAIYADEVEIDIDGLEPLASRPGHPDDVVSVEDVAGTKIDSAFIGSCTNGRIEDLLAAAEILKDREVAPGVVLKIVPSTDRIWKLCLREGIIEIFKSAGALVGNAGCAGCAAGQIGQNGPGEVTISTGNRNFPGKQGRGDVYLASPATAAASAVAGEIVTAGVVSPRPAVFMPEPIAVEARSAAGNKVSPAGRVAASGEAAKKEPPGTAHAGRAAPTSTPMQPKPMNVRGRVVTVLKDNIDTDMIFHNRHLAITDIDQMGQHAFGNLPGWEDFPSKVEPGDIVITGSNFGCGSSRQQAVDCFTSLGVAAIVAKSFGAIYERNAINAGMPLVIADLSDAGLSGGDEIEIDFERGEITIVRSGEKVKGKPFSRVQMQIYQRGGLLRT